MKKGIVEEIKKEDSKIRVIFATTALGMGADSLFIVNIIHISPPSTLESYMQEIGRAGRNKKKIATAILYYNNSDIADNKSHMSESMKCYCDITNSECLRKIILNYFGFKSIPQSRCCCKCEDLDISNKKPHLIEESFTTLTEELKANISDEIEKALNEL